MVSPAKDLRRRAVALVVATFEGEGYRVEPLPSGLGAELAISRDGRDSLVKLLASAGPHKRSSTGTLGLHWMLGDTPAQLVALADVGRSFVWLLPVTRYRALAQPATGGRSHLDWIVAQVGGGRPRISFEEAFDLYRLQAVTPAL